MTGITHLRLSPFLSGRLAKSNAGSAPVLVNELDAGGLY
jgi:hypothetical protein